MILYLSIVLSLTHCRRFQVSGAWGPTRIQESGKERDALPNPEILWYPNPNVGPPSAMAGPLRPGQAPALHPILGHYRKCALMDTAYLLLTRGSRFDSLLGLTYGIRCYGALEGSSGLGRGLGRRPRYAASIRQIVMVMRGAITLISEGTTRECY